MLLINETV